MFIYDKPIETQQDDFLGRTNFSKHLGQSLLNWKEKESLVIAIYGEWGSGKSSVINLAKECIEKSSDKNKPTVIEFNPWLFSEQDNLREHFFNEIAKELELRGDSEKDQKIAIKLKYYASILALAPDKSLFNKKILWIGLSSIFASQAIPFYNWIKYLLFIAGFLLILLEACKNSLSKLADFFEIKANYNKKSVLEVKREIKKELAYRDKKLIIVIDDIDRLNQAEIKQIFSLIRINADFPNTIYLLAFDRNIIEKNLEEQKGISGKDYLDKIVQVTFDIPLAKPNKIATFLFKELDRVLNILPKSSQRFFGQDSTYWANIYHSGFKNFFKNIRDVKRFASSLEFNISQMYRENVMEVNPIDFIAIEAIRVFAPVFYSFMKSRNSLFTSTDRDTGDRNKNPRKIEIEEALNKLPVETKKYVIELIKELFPQIDGVLQHGYSSYGGEWHSSWSKDLRVCSTNNFDSYFTLIPGGDEDEISQYDIENILNKMQSLGEFENILREYIDNNKIRKVLQKIQDYTDDQILIPQSNAKNIVGALFNISDDLPQKRTGMWDFGADMDLMRIIYQILKREKDKNKNFEILKECIPASKGLLGPVKKISLESSRKEKGKNSEEFIVPEDKIAELQKLCSGKIYNQQGSLVKNEKLLYILFNWRDWDKENKWKAFVDNILEDDTKLLVFLNKFISESFSQGMSDYGTRRIKRFDYKSLKEFVTDLDNIKTRLEKTKKDENKELYNANKEVVDMFLSNFANKDKDPSLFDR